MTITKPYSREKTQKKIRKLQRKIALLQQEQDALSLPRQQIRGPGEAKVGDIVDVFCSYGDAWRQGVVKRASAKSLWIHVFGSPVITMVFSRDDKNLAVAGSKVAHLTQVAVGQLVELSDGTAMVVINSSKGGFTNNEIVQLRGLFDKTREKSEYMFNLKPFGFSAARSVDRASCASI